MAGGLRGLALQIIISIPNLLVFPKHIHIYANSIVGAESPPPPPTNWYKTFINV